MDTESTVPTSIRIPVELRDAVNRRAEAEERTFSQQVIYLLRQFVESTPEPRRKAKSRT